MRKEKNVTLKDIAQRVGTSTVSVYRAIHGKDGISMELREQILAEVKKTGYSINEVASTLRREESLVVILLPKPEGDERFYFSAVWRGIRGMEAYYKKFKMKFEYHESEYGMQGMKQALTELFDQTDQSLFGLITLCEDQESLEWLKRFARRGTHVVTIGGTAYEPLQGGCHIQASYTVMGRLAANFAKAVFSGRQGTILFLGGSDAFYSNEEYAISFCKKMEEEMPSCQVKTIEGFNLAEKRQEFMSELRQKDVIAVVACNARLTYAMCGCLKELGLGGKIAAIGTDVFEELVPYFNDGTLISSIYQFPREKAEKALDFLYRMLTGASEKSQGQEIEMPVALVMKENYHFYI